MLYIVNIVINKSVRQILEVIIYVRNDFNYFQILGYANGLLYLAFLFQLLPCLPLAHGIPTLRRTYDALKSIEVLGASVVGRAIDALERS